MCVARTAARRRRQATGKYMHLARLHRPIYSKVSKDKAARKLQRVIMNERKIAGSRGKKKNAS